MDKYIPTIWDRFKNTISWTECSVDDEPQECYLCNDVRSAGKEFVTGPDSIVFLCSACWFRLTLRMMSMPDPMYFDVQ